MAAFTPPPPVGDDSADTEQYGRIAWRLLERAAIPAWYVPVDSDGWVYINRPLRQLLGCSDESPVDSSHFWAGHVHPDDRAHVESLCYAAATTGAPQQDDVRFINADRQLITMQLTIDLVVDPLAAQVLLGVLTDRAAQHVAERSLVERDARRREMLEFTSDVLIVVDTADQVLSITPQGFAPRESQAAPLSIVTLVADADRLAFERWWSIARTGSSQSPIQVRLVTADGKRRYELAAWVLRQAAGQIATIEVVGRELAGPSQAESAARAEAAALRRTDRLKSEFIAIVSHELRTPLHHIKGFATTLLRPKVYFDESQIREYLQIIAEESDKLDRLVVDLLDTSKIEAGSMALDLDSVEIEPLIRKTVLRWQGMEEHAFSVSVPANTPPIPADAYRVTQVLDNLLGNVVRYTPPGTEATVNVDVTREELVVSVTDRGPGIGAEHLPYLFERFYQAGPRAGGHTRGSGLGLFICKGIVEQHGGRIWVEVEPNTGTRFSFTLPRRRTFAKVGKLGT